MNRIDHGYFYGEKKENSGSGTCGSGLLPADGGVSVRGRLFGKKRDISLGIECASALLPFLYAPTSFRP